MSTYKVSDRVLFVGPKQSNYPMPGKTGVVIEVKDDGMAVVQFDEKKINVRPDDKRFKNLTTP